MWNEFSWYELKGTLHCTTRDFILFDYNYKFVLLYILFYLAYRETKTLITFLTFVVPLFNNIYNMFFFFNLAACQEAKSP